MYSKILTGSIVGIDAETVTVETDISSGLPNMTVVGLPDISVREARERIRSALRNAGYRFPSKRITVNLSPADSRKEGTHFDLPIAIGIMVASGYISAEQAAEYAFIGELSLDGKVNAVQGAIALAIGLRNRGVRKLILPAGNKQEVSILKDMQIYPVAHISDVEAHLSGFGSVIPYKGRPRKSFAGKENSAEDFADVAGQESVKRALQVAAAAAHNILMVGPPGAGKTMMANRLPGILPAMTYEECLEVTRIYSLAGQLPPEGGLVTQRPFRSPHHTISPTALAGGGLKPRPGEVSLAHFGVLFLDEFPEFCRKALEVLRQPLEDEKITIARASATVTYPAKIMLVAAMNPCPCGNLGHPTRKCTCSEHQIMQYRTKISGPLADRIDMHIEIFPVPYEELIDRDGKKGKRMDSMQMRKAVESARSIQIDRYRKEKISYNSQLTPSLIQKYCPLDRESEELLKMAFETYSLTARSGLKIIKLARTIADLGREEKISAAHVAEAISYNRFYAVNSGEKNHG
ncbi:MAG: YifB family Mg chelatase-like AAA ATPase [Anaerovoracaceae bacterium]|jgi:magnesium chelatase family protein